MPKKQISREGYSDSEEYLAKKAVFAQMTTIYGRQAVREALLNHPKPKVINLILAEELKPEVTADLLRLASERGINVKWMPKVKLSRITKRQDEDQGMAADLDVQLVKPLQAWLKDAPAKARLLAVVGVTTPANIGIIARSVAAAGIAGLVIPEQGCPTPTLPLVIKASAGNIFRTQLFGVADGEELMRLAKEAGWSTFALTSEKGSSSLFDHQPPQRAIYLLGNESIGLPAEIVNQATATLRIPLANSVDSLNVAAAATLVAFHLV